MRWRRTGKTRLRWLGTSGTAAEYDGISLSDAINLTVRKWFPSNSSPDRMVLMIVVEREGQRMSDEEADQYVRQELGVMHAARERPKASP